MNAFTPHPDVVARRVDDQIVLVHLGRNQIFSLNVTGGRLWELLSDGVPEAEATAQLREEFDVPDAEVEAEVAAFWVLLERERLVLRRSSID